MAGNAGTRARAAAVATPVSAEGVALYIASAPDDFSNASIASLPGYGNLNNYAIEGSLNITAGSGTTSVTLRCRRGNGITGTQIGASISLPLAAGATNSFPFDFTDAAAPANGFAGYSITVQQSAGTGAGTVNEIDGSTASYI